MKKMKYSLLLRQAENALALMLSDALMLLLALVIGNYILYWIYQTPITIRYSIMIIPTWWIGSVVVGIVPGWGLGAVEELRRIELLLICVFTLAAVAYFFSRELMLPSRVVYVGSYLGAALLIPISRALCKRILIRLALWGAPAAIYGDSKSSARIVAAFGRDSGVGYNPAAVFSDDLPPGATVAGLPVAGSLAESDADLPVAIVSLANIAEQDLTAFLDNQLGSYHKVVLLPNINEDVFSWIIPRNFGGVVGLEVTRNLLLPFVLNIKSMLEIFLVLLAAPLWLPCMLLIAVAILVLDHSPPFYTQIRVGRYGERFKTIKFRTMRRNADQELEQRMAEDPELRRQWETGFKLKDDPRVTRLGAFLRKYSLDEIPQLFNVLWGDMSLVGPRPLPEYHHDALSFSAFSPRYRVRPGMTGLWQVSGRSLLAQEDMDKWDTYYVRNWSIWLDLVILARTFTAVFSSRGAF
jgi:Undecaprenyl-phosphate galactose phosphotransferase WbaP